ncbi:transglutaminase-like domain-containing protein [Micromonospora okii]|uniref:Aminotransferase n=1 Tax=Micromonospora okii TaxID=1182970 RepID=A0A023GUL7_9ACTN|nr:transglutaminase-like domain-containing protein [Micromonospora okii]AFJ52699.1 aminotransferase [Micromonospora okii]
MGTGTPGDADLAATYFLDHDSPEVADFVARSAPADADPTTRAVALYYAVRDGIQYEVYSADLSRAGLRASSTLRSGTGMCIHKSILYASALRSIGIPSRLVLADVRNHLTSDRLRSLMGGDVFRHHCYTKVHLDGRWVKATPVFSRRLCRLYRITQLEFDGRTDSLYHPYDLDGRQHMEFLHTHGEFSDLPYDRIVRDLRIAHPGLFAATMRVVDGSLERDAVGAAERR